jgi:general secretion pathway protein J
MLVALFIFAVISAAGVGIVTYGIDAKAATRAATDRLRDVQIARALLKADLAQPVRRAVRDAYGDNRLPAFSGGITRQGDGTLMSFVRGGWANPGQAQARSTLQFVQYVVEDGKFIRRSRVRLDATVNTPEDERVLLSGVSNVEVRFWSGGQWADRYGTGRAEQTSLPDAVALDMDVEGFGHLTQLFLVRG